MKMKKHIIIMLVMLSLLHPQINFANTQYSSNIYVLSSDDNITLNNDEAIIKSTYIIYNNGTTDVSSVHLRISSFIFSNVTISSSNGVNSYTHTETTLGTDFNIILANPIHSNSNTSIVIRYVSKDIISQRENDMENNLKQILIYYKRPIYDTLNYSVYVALPISAHLDDNVSQAIYPVPSNNFTDGQRIIFSWHINRIQPGEEKLFVVFYEYQEETIVNVNWLELVLFLAAGIFIGALLMKYNQKIIGLFRIKKHATTRLTRDEKKIIKYIQGKGGIVPQKSIYLDLDMSQARLSLILSGLEAKGQIRRDKRGRENIVRLVAYTE